MPKPGSGPLTKKEQVFVQEYLIDLNAARAARAAGYSEKTSNVKGAQLLQKPRVQLAVQQSMAERAKRTEISQDSVLSRLDNIGDVDPALCYNEKGQFHSIHDIPPEIRKCIKSIKVFEEFDGVGRDREKIGEVVEVTFWDKVKSNELLGKHLGIWKDVLELKDGNGRAERLARARARVKGKLK
jgi:phage terminase small subunit